MAENTIVQYIFQVLFGMTAKQFYDWQTAGGTDDVMRLVEAHPHLWDRLTGDLKKQVQPPEK